INTHHNYTEPVEIDGRTLWLTRKGAINAEAGRPGLIPGSMGARSYVTRGKGNTQAFWSAPHGAGRVLSRRAAKKRYTAEDLDQRMSGIVYRPGPAWVDEIPVAYKPIDQVMADARDLVEVVHELRQVLNLKGTYPRACGYAGGHDCAAENGEQGPALRGAPNRKCCGAGTEPGPRGARPAAPIAGWRGHFLLDAVGLRAQPALARGGA